MSNLTLSDFRRKIEHVAFKRAPHDRFVAKNGSEAPWGFDLRSIMLTPDCLSFYADTFWNLFSNRYPFQVGGPETAGIPLVAAIVMKGKERKMPVNGFFVRTSRKKEGLMNSIEGTLDKTNIILVDDLINSGASLYKTLLLLEERERRVTDMFTILAFRPKDAYQFATERDICVHHLFTLEDFGIPLESPHTPNVPFPSFEILWHFKSGEPGYQFVVQKSAPTIDNKRVYFGSDRGTLWALNQEDGSIAWEYQIGLHPKGKGIFSTPAITNNTVYFGAYDGNIYALDAVTGKEKWIFMEADWVGSSPALAPDLGILFIGIEFGFFKKRGGIVALDLITGNKRWNFEMPEYVHSSPLYIPEEQIVVIGCNDGNVYCFGARDGTLRWKKAVDGPVKSSFAYDSKNRLILFGSNNGHAYALASSNGSEMWKQKMGAGICATPLICDRIAYLPSLDKRIYAFDVATGNERWTFTAKGRIFASPIIANGSLWVGSNDGRLYELSSESGKLRSFFQTTERIVNAIAYNKHSRSIFLSTHANEIYCLRQTAYPHGY